MAKKDLKFAFRVKLAFDKEDELWYADCENLQGCHTFGETKQEALDRISEIITDRLVAGVQSAKETAKQSVETRTQASSRRPATATLELALS